MSNEELAKKVRELKELEALESELKAEIASLEDDLKGVLTDMGVDELAVDVFKVRFKEVKSTRFDKDVLIAKTNRDFYNECCKEVSYKRFSVA